MTPLYPLRFAPIYQRYLWGGRRLETVVGKHLPPGDDYAESWEIVDRAEAQSTVLAGPLAGTTLHELVSERGEELLGRHHPRPRFPLLLKYLDAHQALSVQVHPDDHRAAKLDPPDLGKTEAWVVMHADPGSVIYAGLQPDVDRKKLKRAVERGEVESCLHRFEPRAGDCVFLPAGTIHALGAGIVLAEIQQSSNVTYRLFDWNRTGPDGQPRELHVKEALNTINFEAGPIDPRRGGVGEPVERLAACEKFTLDRWHLAEPRSIRSDDRVRIIAVVDGAITIEGDPVPVPLERGTSVLVPSDLGRVEIRPVGEATLLMAYLP